MKRYVNPIPNGGAPLQNNRINSELQSEIWDGINALLAPFNGDTEGVILSGVSITANGGGFDMTAGLVYLDGAIMRVGAGTSLSFPKYIVADAVTYEQKTFADLTNKNLVEVKNAAIQGSIPGGGVKYIAITSIDSAAARRRRLSTYVRGTCVAQARVEAFGGAGIVYQSGIPLAASSDSNSEITITHNLGNTNYTVQLTVVGTGSVDVTAVSAIGNNSFKIINAAGAARAEVFVAIFIQ